MNIKNIKNIRNAILPEVVSEKERVTMGFRYLGEAVPPNKFERLPDVDVMEFGREFLKKTTRENMLQQNTNYTNKILLNMQDAINNLL